jgi:adenine-specific DNA-methyltransferase
MNDKNLSKQKRESVLKALEQIRNDLSNDVLKSQVNMIESFVTENKFGLIFEKHSEDVLEKIKDQVPVFFNSDSKEIISKKDGNYNFILEGDNLHSLYLLSKTHKKTIDLIYIDPPYNNGSKDWKYNNDFIDSNDGYRHSKWLSMMSSRLVLAKKLLKRDGVLICAIDENEQANKMFLVRSPEMELIQKYMTKERCLLQ